MKSFSSRLLAVIAVLSLLANVLLYMRYSTNRPLMTVGSEIITKKQYMDTLEHQAGQEVLSKMVLTKLIMQAATQAGVVPTTQDVDAQIKEIERTSPQILAPYMQDQGKMAEFKQDLTAKLALDSLRIKDVALSPTEVAAYYAQHKAQFALPQQVMTTTVITNNAVDASTAADLLRQNQRPDAIGRQPRMSVVGVNGYNPDLSVLPATVREQISSTIRVMKAGDVKTFQSGPWFLTMRVSRNNRAEVPSLDQVRPQVEREARLEKAPSAAKMLARLYQSAKPTFQYDKDKYSSYFAAVQNYPVDSADSNKTARVQ